jgi:hypothetical protein
MTINRWFVRCLDCLSVAAVTETPNTSETLAALNPQSGGLGADVPFSRTAEIAGESATQIGLFD